MKLSNFILKKFVTQEGKAALDMYQLRERLTEATREKFEEYDRARRKAWALARRKSL